MFDINVVNNTDIRKIKFNINEFISIINNGKEAILSNSIYYCNYFSQFLSPRIFTLGDRNLVWRARTNQGKLFTHISQLWYPEQEITPLGRCNFANQPLFYGALEENTAIFEVEKEKNKIVTSLGLFPENPIRCFHLGPKEVPKTLAAESRFEQHRSNESINNFIDKRLTNSLPSLYYLNKAKYDLVTEFISKLFVSSNKNIYPFTSLLCLKLLNTRDIDAVTFSSVASHHSGINIVMKPIFADKNLMYRFLNIVETEYEIFHNKDSGYWELSIYKDKSVATANCDYDGTIYWFFNINNHRKILKEDKSFIIEDKKPIIRFKTSKSKT